jgi:hypothetical protein
MLWFAALISRPLHQASGIASRNRNGSGNLEGPQRPRNPLRERLRIPSICGRRMLGSRDHRRWPSLCGSPHPSREQQETSHKAKQRLGNFVKVRWLQPEAQGEPTCPARRRQVFDSCGFAGRSTGRPARLGQRRTTCHKLAQPGRAGITNQLGERRRRDR